MPIHNYCSPIRMADLDDLSADKNQHLHRGISDNNLNNSAMLNRYPNTALEKLKNEIVEKDRMLEQKNKEIVSLSLQIEDIIGNQGNIRGASNEFENARRNLLIGLSQVTQRLKKELLVIKATILNDYVGSQRIKEEKSPNYKIGQVSEEYFLNDID
jgi:hypothetical protein